MSEIITAFPGYEFKEVPGYQGKQNVYRGTVLGFGGYIVGEPGIYTNVALLDISGMHSASIIAMNYFGEYTKRYKELREARIFIKHHDYESASKLFDGKLTKYLSNPEAADQLSKAVKLPLNQAYGLTSATFDNPMRDRRNVNNIVALRGALFMRTLQDEVEARGFHIVAIRTDSIKIPEANKEIIEFCMDFAKKYGYEFEHEATYERMCLVNKSAYIAKYAKAEWCQEHYGYSPKECKKHGGQWTATAAQFQVPYVFKTLFSKEPLTFDDMCETKSVQKGAIYLDMNEKLPEGEHNYIFVGRVGQFTPVDNGAGGGELLCKRDNGTYAGITGTVGYRWLESEVIRKVYSDPVSIVDRGYYTKLVDGAIDAINKYGDFEWFVSDDPGVAPWDSPGPPWDDGRTAFDVR